VVIRLQPIVFNETNDWFSHIAPALDLNEGVKRRSPAGCDGSDAARITTGLEHRRIEESHR